MTESPSNATMPKMLANYQPYTQKPMGPLSRAQGIYPGVQMVLPESLCTQRY